MVSQEVCPAAAAGRDIRSSLNRRSGSSRHRTAPISIWPGQSGLSDPNRPVLRPCRNLSRTLALGPLPDPSIHLTPSLFSTSHSQARAQDPAMAGDRPGLLEDLRDFSVRPGRVPANLGELHPGSRPGRSDRRGLIGLERRVVPISSVLENWHPGLHRAAVSAFSLGRLSSCPSMHRRGGTASQ